MKSSFNVPTSQSCEFVDITSQVQKAVTEAKIAEGIVIVYVAHTTAGVTINENADPSVQHDILNHLDEMVPQSSKFRHAEGNSPAHIKASMMGSSATVLVSEAKLMLGTWQGVYFCEFDGPRTRQVWVKVIAG
jgi:secondary thiamine-phosphate synthase enzyme